MEKDQKEPGEEIQARAETAPEAPEPLPRGNVLSELEEDSPGVAPPPLPI